MKSVPLAEFYLKFYLLVYSLLKNITYPEMYICLVDIATCDVCLNRINILFRIFKGETTKWTEYIVKSGDKRPSTLILFLNFIKDQLIIIITLKNPNINVCMYICMYVCMHVFMYVCMLNKNSLGLLKKGAAKQSRIKSIAWHLRWLVRTRADISLRPSGLVRP